MVLAAGGFHVFAQRGCWAGLLLDSTDAPDGCFHAPGVKEDCHVTDLALPCEPFCGCWHGHIKLTAVVDSVTGLCFRGDAHCRPSCPTLLYNMGSGDNYSRWWQHRSLAHKWVALAIRPAGGVLWHGLLRAPCCLVCGSCPALTSIRLLACMGGGAARACPWGMWARRNL
jgi:hypothetical protein